MSNNATFELEQRWRAVQDRIFQAVKISDHSIKEPMLVAVSKFQSLEDMISLYELGQRDFGENYVQELISKAKVFQERGLSEVRFHFIGHLQSNKVKALIPWVDTIQTIDSLKLLDEVEKQAAALQRKITVYFQINIDQEKTKSGFMENELDELVRAVTSFHYAKASGLMTIPDPKASLESAFSRMRDLSRRYSEKLGSGLSMGMSDDFVEAISYGSTLVRVGTAIFGARK